MKTDLVQSGSVAPTPGRPVAAVRRQGTEAPAVPLFPEAAATARTVTDTQAARAAVEANRRLAEEGRELAIEFDDGLGRSIFKIIDSQTGEVLRQIPSAEALAIARALKDGTAGALVRSSA